MAPCPLPLLLSLISAASPHVPEPCGALARYAGMTNEIQGEPASPRNLTLMFCLVLKCAKATKLPLIWTKKHLEWAHQSSPATLELSNPGARCARWRDITGMAWIGIHTHT